ncbi:hypothetical protein BKA64DRAFT_700618 [Cadophora sp. MPI-SDFR-AT-0126]|nr:hypothetical protein BKA64DRAFT_700618 [Leotiomycetes sp. MPI-SDFR-AT-0126]
MIRSKNQLAGNAPRLAPFVAKQDTVETTTQSHYNSLRSPGTCSKILSGVTEEHDGSAVALSPMLPFELRLGVLEAFASFAGPRDVVVSLSRPPSDNARPSFMISTPGPDILKMYKEARELGLKKYKTAINTKEWISDNTSTTAGAAALTAPAPAPALITLTPTTLATTTPPPPLIFTTSEGPNALALALALASAPAPAPAAAAATAAVGPSNPLVGRSYRRINA